MKQHFGGAGPAGRDAGRAGLHWHLPVYLGGASDGAPPQPAVPGAAHVCLEVDDIAHTWKELLAAGATGQGRIASVKSGPVDSCLAGYIRDPNGIIIELLELKKD